MLKPLSTDKEAAIPLHLLREMRHGNALLFVGSGLSLSLGYPTWGSLVQQIYEAVQSTLATREPANGEWIRAHFASEPDWVAEVIHSTSPDQYSSALRTIFLSTRRRDPSVNHLLCALLPFKGYLTTNYDTNLEDYLTAFYADDLPVFDYEEALRNYAAFSTAARYVLKLHGCVRKDPEKIVLTSRQYYKLLHDQRYTRLLAAIFSKHTILCIGFSLRDRDFRCFLEERHHLYERRCPPLYAIVPTHETCPLETALLRNQYNVQLVTISPENDCAELTSFLYSLYCLVLGEDSASFSDRFIGVAMNKAYEKGLFDLDDLVPEDGHISEAKRLLSHFRDPLGPETFVAFCLESGVRLSPAELFCFADRTLDGRVTLRRPVEEDADAREKLARWIATELESIPVTVSPRHFASYHKELFARYSATISALLRHAECWDRIIGRTDNAVNRLTRICQFFKQDGRWSEWITIAEAASEFLDVNDPVFKPLMQSMLWVYFWTRRFRDAQALLLKYPDLDDKEGEHNYSDRIRYMQPQQLKLLIQDILQREHRDYFATSMLGRAYAQLSLHRPQREEFLHEAEKHLRESLAAAADSADWIERSVQSWYLAVVLSDLGESEEAKHHLAEVRRLDESIMNRVPGLAWLALADYRIALNDKDCPGGRVQELRAKAIESFQRLGIVEIGRFIDEEYYY